MFSFLSFLFHHAFVFFVLFIFLSINFTGNEGIDEDLKMSDEEAEHGTNPFFSENGDEKVSVHS